MPPMTRFPLNDVEASTSLSGSPGGETPARQMSPHVDWAAVVVATASATELARMARTIDTWMEWADDMAASQRGTHSIAGSPGQREGSLARAVDPWRA